MKRHFVEFCSPGTIVPEITRKPIESWDIDLAQEMARGIIERHNATPYGFRFITRGRSSRDLDSKIIAKSNFYVLGGTVETRKEIELRNLPDEKILRSNMRANGYERVVVNTNSWKMTLPLEDDTMILDWTP